MSFRYIIFFCIFVGAWSCENKYQNNNYAQLYGSIDILYDTWSDYNGVKIVLTNLSDASIKHIALSDAEGKFQFYDIEAGTYSFEVIKEGCSLMHIYINGKYNYQDNIIQLIGGEATEIRIILKGKSENPYNAIFPFKITDLNGSSITSIDIPKYTKNIMFKLNNDSKESHYYNCEYRERCFIGNYMYIFDDFFPKSGTLESGGSVVLFGAINQEIWQLYDTRPTLYFNTLVIRSGFSSSGITLNLEF